jgi:hypothetical protein
MPGNGNGQHALRLSRPSDRGFRRAGRPARPSGGRARQAMVAAARRGGEQMTLQVFKRRFDELLAQLGEVEKTKWKNTNGALYVTDELFLGWRVKARNLISRTCGEESEHYRQFVQVEVEKVAFVNERHQSKNSEHRRTIH